MNVDGEVRIYTDQYTSFPMGIHFTANPTLTTVDTGRTDVDEAANLTEVAGVWSFSQNQSKKMTVNSDGSVVTYHGSGSVTPTGDAGRAFSFNTTGWNATMTLNDQGDRLTSTPRANTPIGIKGSPYVLSVSYYSQAEDQNIIVWGNNSVSAQSFTFDPLGDGTYRIIAGNSGKVFGMLGDGTTSGTPLVQQTWSHRPGQIFRLESLGDGTWYRIVNLGTGLALNISGTSPANEGIDISKGVLITLNDWNDSAAQHFTLTSDQVNMVRRPWDKGCNAGEVNYAGFCYDVPPGYAMTFPGFMGQACPKDWRDDGTWCWPVWKGVAVSAMADPDGGDNLRHPLTVTNCSSYNQTKNQSCPANFTHSAVCTCQASASSKNVSVIVGHIPGQ